MSILNTKVLVLNRSYLPVHVTSVRRAFILLYQDIARAVDEQYRRQGLGSHLLMDVFVRVAAVAEHAGFFALTLVSLDEDSTAFYESLGFTIYSENLKLPKMLYPLQSILTLVQSQPA